MQLKTIVLASLASLALGQTATSSAAQATGTSTCAAQNILDACLSSTKGQLTSCTSTDYDCQCNAYGVILTCYNNCPNDPTAFSAQQNRDSFCNAASAYGTKTSSKSAVAAATSATAATTATVARASSATGSASGAASTQNAASGLKVGSSIFAVAVAGLGLLA